ncbi:MAG: MATE family efflux transporter [Oscillospiraceae bacterium]|nr:MATE family efflux transporter [Oscillospiraceae bacterium]
MSFWVKDKQFYQKMAAIAIPLALQNLINVAVSLLDTVMLGQLGEVAMSGSALGNQIGFIYQIMNLGLTAGAGVLTSQYWGRKDPASIRKVMSMAYKISMALATVFTVLALAIPDVLMRFYTEEPAVIEAGALYLRIIAFTYWVSGFTMTSMSILRTVGTVKITLYMYVVSFFVNVFFNYCFIFGHFGFPKMGIAGAAIATVIARVVECAIIVVYVFRIDKKICFQVRDIFQKIDREVLGIYMRYGAPVLCNEMLWSIGSTMLSVIMGHMGSGFVAANSICQVIFQCTSVINQGVGQAAGVMAGNTIGEGKYKRARNQSLTLFVVSIGFGLLSSLVMFAIRGPVIDFYKVTEETRAIAYSIMDMMCILIIFQAISSVNMFGTLRGGGDSRFVLIFDVTSMWFFSVPMGWLAGLVFHWPVWVVYLCLRSGDIFKSVACVFRILSGKWIKDVTRSESEKEEVLEEEIQQV